MNTSNTFKFTGWIIFIHVLMMLTAGLILIFMFDFPDILRKSMEETLGLFHKNRSFTVPAYYLFTMTGISFMTVALLLHHHLKLQKSTVGYLASIYGVLFGLTSSLGFVRRPFLMQYLGEKVASGENALESLRIVYDSFHIYSGVSVGENFAFWFEFLWMVCFSTALISRTDLIPKYIARIGQVLGVGMLVYSMEQFGGIFHVLGPLNMIVHTGQLAWFIALSFALFNVDSAFQGKLKNWQKMTSIGLFVSLLIASFI